MLVLNCIVVSELCNGMLYIFSLNQPTCSSSVLPSVSVNLKTGRKGEKATKPMPTGLDPRMLIFQNVYKVALHSWNKEVALFIPAPRESLLPCRESCL